MTRSLLALAAATLGLVACGGDGRDADPPASATPTVSPTATSSPAPEATPAQTPGAAGSSSLWPPPDRSSSEPGDVARTFVADFIGLARPALGRFREAEPGAGEVAVFRRGEDGTALASVVSTLSLRRLDDGSWAVVAARSPEVRLTAPEPLAEVSSPLAVTGRGRGFEGNVVLQVRSAFNPEPLAQEPVVAGAMGELEPFSAELRFRTPGPGAGAIVALTGSGVAAVDGFAAFPVQLGD